MKPLIIAAALFAATTATAGHYLGFSDTTVDGGSGLHAMNEACRATYGEAKLCNSKDIFDSPTTKSNPTTGFAWVHRFPMGPTWNYSGYPGATCYGWSSNADSSGNDGLVVDENLRFLERRCSYSSFVACCKSSSAYRISPN